MRVSKACFTPPKIPLRWTALTSTRIWFRLISLMTQFTKELIDDGFSKTKIGDVESRRDGILVSLASSHLTLLLPQEISRETWCSTCDAARRGCGNSENCFGLRLASSWSGEEIVRESLGGKAESWSPQKKSSCWITRKLCERNLNDCDGISTDCKWKCRKSQLTNDYLQDAECFACARRWLNFFFEESRPSMLKLDFNRATPNQTDTFPNLQEVFHSHRTFVTIAARISPAMTSSKGRHKVAFKAGTSRLVSVIPPSSPHSLHLISSISYP